MTPVRSTPRWLSRLSSLLLILALLSVLVVPAFAQPGVASLKPPAGDRTQELLTGATCTPLTDQEKVEYHSLAARKADGLSDADYGRLIALSQKSNCAAQPNVLVGPEVVSTYTFAQSSGTYTAIAGGSTLGTATNDDTLFPNLDIGFSFTYNDNPYTKVAICSNGYIVMGLTSGASCAEYTPISSTTYNNLISALGRDLQGNTTTGELRYQTQGSAPNRTFTVQWKSYRKYNATGDDFNFQITLNETTNVVQIKYGAFTVNATSSTPQVGIKGASNADYSNRTTTTDWSASTAGGTNAATMTLSSAVKPASGQTYTWTPPVVVTPPSCATSFSPADLATGVAATANLTWASGGGAPTGYKIFFGTDNPPTNIANGSDLGLVTTYDPPGNMAYSTLHYWKIVPYNANGDASGCSVLSFTTQADPTIGVFPYSQDFNGASFPGWTVENTNGDGNAWGLGTTHLRGTMGGAAIVYYNESLATNDWLFTPPLQLIGGTTYGVRFFYRSSGVAYPEKLEVKWGTSASSASMTNGPIFDNPNVNFNTMKEAIATFTPAANGVYYVGFHGYSIPNQFYVVVDDVTVYNTADSTWQWQGGTSNDWFVNGNWEGAIVPGEMDLVEIPVVAEAPNASSPLIGTSVETSYGKVNNLTVNAGATLELASVNNLKVEGTLTNNGWLKQTKFAANGSLTEFLRVKNVAGTVDKYSGVDLTPTSIAMGNTTVIVKGNQECPQVNAPANTVNRCYEITPTTVGPAFTRFYFDSAERGSLVLANLNGWHYNTGTSAFDLLPATANPPGGSGAREYVEATTTTYSPFAVASGNPLAVTLASFGAQGSSDRVVVSWETLSEANNAGFNVYRADNDAGPQTLLAYVPSQGPGSTQGYAYSHDDVAVQAGQTYWYWLEDVSLGGATTLHGPVSATVSAPTAVTLSRLEAGSSSVPVPLTGLAFVVALLATAAGLAWRRKIHVS